MQTYCYGSKPVLDSTRLAVHGKPRTIEMHVLAGFSIKCAANINVTYALIFTILVVLWAITAGKMLSPYSIA